MFKFVLDCSKVFTVFCLVLVNIFQYCILEKTLSNRLFNTFTKIVLSVLNVKVVIHGNVSYLQDPNMLIMANHYDGLDALVMYTIIQPPIFLFVVGKHDIVGNVHDNNIVSNSLFLIKDIFTKSIHLISYKKNDKDSGVLVKNTIVDVLNNENNSVLVFPEGTTHKGGIPKDFKSGIFHLACENNMTILPITIVYEKDIGTEITDPVDFFSCINNICHIYVHDKMSNTDFACLKEQTFNAINSPFLKIKHN